MMSAVTAVEVPTERVARDVLENLLEGCQVVGFDFTYRYVNETVVAQSRTPRAQLLGRTMMECYPGIETTAMFAVLSRCMSTRQHGRFDNEFTFADGSQGCFELRFVPVPEGICVLSLDVTEARRTTAALARSEEQFRQAQKMDALGRLASGVAHDFNNLLSVILSYTSLILSDLQPGDPIAGDLQEIKTAGERASDLTRRLLAFSRRQILEPRILDLNEVIANMEKMIRRLIGEDIELKFVADAGLGKAKADPGYLDQVIMNLVVNARDAMPEGGKLTIETQNVELDALYAAAHLGVTPGAHVMLAVSDTGIGMDKATQQRIFEPFFTTKEKGKGTGLGLSTVFGIVRQSGGSIWVYSEPGHGTTFKVFLPRSEEQARAPVERVRGDGKVTGSETVLLVEDDDQLRCVAHGILERAGYRVLQAGNGPEALLACQKHGGPIQLLLTDVVMPQMSGRELAERVLFARPGIRVLYMSGYTDDAIIHHRVLAPGVALLQKPITPDALLRRLREVLDAPHGS
jgi:two-component system, cell cycle sensor histidine kinase and response regulator CckA